MSDRNSVLFARQPILDEHMGLFAYELLYRDPGRPIRSQRDGDRATGHVVVESLSNLHEHVSDTAVPMFVNLTRSVLLDFSDPPFPPEMMVMELLEDIHVDQAVIDAVAALKEKGFRIALDDFVWKEEWKPLLPMADIIKVDVLDCTAGQVGFLVERLKPFDAILLAEKVESRTMFEHCRRLGFSLFQGYFFAQPELVSGAKLSPNASNLLELMGSINKPDIDAKTLALVISRDAVLTLKLLRLVNSAAFSAGRSIDTIQQAVAVLGLRKLRSWVMLLLLAGVENKPPELLRMLVLRAAMAERVGAALAIDQPDRCFMVGLISGLDAMMDAPAELVLDNLPLADAMREAVLHGKGPLGGLIEAIKSYEQADWENVFARLPGVSPRTLWDAYRDSLQWVSEVMRELR